MNVAITSARRASNQPGYDRLLLLSVIALMSVGVVMVYSASIAGNGANLQNNAQHLIRQLMHLALGATLLLFGALIKLTWLQRASRVLLVLALLALMAVLAPSLGVEVNGSMRWIEFGGVRLQPSELVKLAVVIYFADYFSRKREDLHRFQVGVVNVGLVVGAVGVLLLLEPDFGATAVIVMTVGAMMFLAGLRFWHFCISLAVAGGLLIAILTMAPYRAQRLISHRNPWADPYDGGFQLVQSLIAIGRGEWFGAGLGNSIQKLFYLPHGNNDFVIAVIGEELGAAGIFAMLLLYALVLARAFAIARRAHARGLRFGGFLAQGVGLLISLQAAIHIGVNTGLLPTKGLTLPLVSYGGTSLLSAMASIGLLFAVDRHSRARALRRAP